MGGGASRPWLEQPDIDRPDAEGPLRRNNIQPYLESQQGAFIGAGDGRMGISLQARRSQAFMDRHRGPRSMAHARRYRALPESLLAALAGAEEQSSGAVVEASSQSLAEEPQEAAGADGSDKSHPPPAPMSSPQLASGLEEQEERGQEEDGRTEDVPSALNTTGEGICSGGC
ncbi:uncharacterized protein LOC116420269 [Sarcophilus harrisii]|uniref:uncharacterized protein LOC116420269 n=1 Tax=Sarcophilus harrisii TaxID=9305 RepID=UPI001301B5F2|nr:uncharacterized protein LOC116420269 [Sarcophilus harrisii]